MVTTKSIRESRRARRTPSAKSLFTQPDVVDPISSIEEDAWRNVATLGGEAPEEELL
jgi:hypothetical protein